MSELIKKPKDAVPDGFFANLRILEMPDNCLEAVIRTACGMLALPVYPRRRRMDTSNPNNYAAVGHIRIK